MCSIAWRGRGSKGCTDSNSGRTCSAHAAAHKAKSRWSESVSVPPRRMVMNRGSRSLGRITVAPFLLYLPNVSYAAACSLTTPRRCFYCQQRISSFHLRSNYHKPVIHLEPQPSIRGNKLLVLLEPLEHFWQRIATKFLEVVIPQQNHDATSSDKFNGSRIQIPKMGTILEARDGMPESF